MEFLTTHSYFSLLFGILILSTLLSTVSLVKNIRYAKTTGLNYIVYPLTFGGPLLIFVTAFRPVRRLLLLLPLQWQDYFNNATFGAHWRVKGRLAKRYGGVYLTVSAARVACFVCDAEAANEIMSNRERFPKPWKAYDSLTLFGPNIVTVGVLLRSLRR
jgi:hypothetical protein